MDFMLRRRCLAVLTGMLFASVHSAGRGVAAPLDLAGIGSDLSFIEQQAGKTVAALASPAVYPRAGGDSGAWSTVGAADWTSGFFPGEMWLLYQATGSAQWRSDAQAWTAPLAAQATRTDTHDVGFIIGASFGNGYRLTGDPVYKTTILQAGAALATRFNPTIGAVRSWDFGSWQSPVIIDNMMTLGPLQWGAANGGNPAWAAMASAHAATTAADLVRTDGGTFHLADFNPATGALLAQETYQGYANSSTWTRGQAWGLYGFVQAFQATGNPAFLATAEQLATFYIDNLPTDFVPYWDFNAPVSATTPRDTSSAAIAADGLVLLSTLAETPAEQAAYLLAGRNILGALSTGAYLAPGSSDAVLAHGSGFVPAGSEVDTALIYGDYFFTEGLLRLQDALLGQPEWSLYDSAATPVPEPASFVILAASLVALLSQRLRNVRMAPVVPGAEGW